MPATKRLVLDLPADQVDLIEARVEAGDYASASAFVAARLEDTEPAFVDDSPEWRTFGERVRETLRRVDAGIEPTYTADEGRADLSERRAARPAG